MSDCRFGVSPVNYPDPDPGIIQTQNFKRRGKEAAFVNSNQADQN